MPQQRKRRDLTERFWSKVDKSGGPDACWPWYAPIYHGYGRFSVESKKSVPAHRFAYELTNGPIPDGLLVCHKCDNRACCNPAHHFLGTDADNIHDCVAKGRNAHGSRNGRAKLTEEQVREIRAAYPERTQDSLAREYGVSQRLISLIVRGENWRRV